MDPILPAGFVQVNYRSKRRPDYEKYDGEQRLPGDQPQSASLLFGFLAPLSRRSSLRLRNSQILSLLAPIVKSDLTSASPRVHGVLRHPRRPSVRVPLEEPLAKAKPSTFAAAGCD